MSNRDQQVVWNADVGSAWAGNVEHYDSLLAPLGLAVMDRLSLQPGERVVDVGCGVGTTSGELGRRTSPGTVVGVDISTVMIDEARLRLRKTGLTNVTFLVADAQVTPFGTERFDVAFSRLGVMFFSDPVAAFTNLAASMAPDGRVGFVCLQSPMHNPLITEVVLATVDALGPPQMPHPDEPGPFSFADPDRINDVLERAGWHNVRIAPGPDEATMHGAHDLPALAERSIMQNPALASRMSRADEPTRNSAIASVAAALEPHREDDVVRLGVGTWIVLASVAN